MKLIGMLDSPFVRRVAISMHVLGIPFEHRSISVFRHVEEFGTFNPLTRAPTLILDDGQFLPESSFILDYLDDLAGDRRLVPASGAGRLAAHQKIALALTAAEKSVMLIVETRLRPEALHHGPVIERCRNQIVTALALLEREAFPVLSGGALDQVAITTAVVFRFVRHVDESLLMGHDFPNLWALSTFAEKLPVFVEAPLA